MASCIYCGGDTIGTRTACYPCKATWKATVARARAHGEPAPDPLPTVAPLGESGTTLPPGRPVRQSCGTVAGYSRHMKRGERPCEPCREARNDYQRTRHARLRELVALPMGHGTDRTWMERAACKGMDTDLFFSGRGENHDISDARAVCQACPVRRQCLDYALAEHLIHGVWGGTSERQRRGMRRQPREAS